MVPCASSRRAGQYHLPGLCSRVGFNDDPIDLGRSRKIVFPADGYLLGISPGLDMNAIAGLGGIDGVLDSSEAGRIAPTSGVGAINVKRRRWLLGDEGRRREHQAKKQQRCKT